VAGMAKFAWLFGSGVCCTTELLIWGDWVHPAPICAAYARGKTIPFQVPHAPCSSPGFTDTLGNSGGRLTPYRPWWVTPFRFGVGLPLPSPSFPCPVPSSCLFLVLVLVLFLLLGVRSVPSPGWVPPWCGLGPPSFLLPFPAFLVVASRSAAVVTSRYSRYRGFFDQSVFSYSVLHVTSQ
jgi:hypothetical protein